MDVYSTVRVLNSRRRLSFLKILIEKDLTALGVHEKYQTINGTELHRESTWRDLEILTRVGLLSKRYDTDEKRIFYHLEVKEIVLNLKSQNALLKN